MLAKTCCGILHTFRSSASFDPCFTGYIKIYDVRIIRISSYVSTSSHITYTQTSDPEYIRPSGVKRFGFGRSQAYVLINAGVFRSKNVKLPGQRKGMRLIEVASIRAYIEGCPGK
jgi:hypothetical protein